MIVIGDIHGCFKTFINLLDIIPQNDKEIYLVGDLIDRGPRSRQVISFLESKPHIKSVRGNHEDMAILAHKSNPGYGDRECWLSNGGRICLDSYKRNAHGFMYLKPVAYIKSLPLFIETEDYIICHSGDITDPWERYGITESEKLIIHGHTPVEEPHISEAFIDIDTGCCFKGAGMGILTAIELPSMNIYQVKNQDQM